MTEYIRSGTAHQKHFSKMKKLLVLENDTKHMGIPDMLDRVLKANRGYEIDPWFWFSADVRQNPEMSFKRFAAASADPETWCITYPSFAGPGNSFEGKLSLFKALMDHKIKLRIYVVHYPDFYWFLVSWLHDIGAALGSDKRKVKDIDILKEVLAFHEIYSAPYRAISSKGTTLDKAMERVTWERLQPNHFSRHEKVKIRCTGKIVEFAGIRADDSDDITVNVWEPTGKGNSQTLKTYSLSEVERFRKKPAKPKKPAAFDITKGRLTSARMVQWLNQEFKRLEITDWVVTAVERTHFRDQDYEAGACKLRAHFENVKSKSTKGEFLCFYSLGEYQDHMSKGYEMYIKFHNHRFGILSELTVELRKKEK